MVNDIGGTPWPADLDPEVQLQLDDDAFYETLRLACRAGLAAERLASFAAVGRRFRRLGPILRRLAARANADLGVIGYSASWSPTMLLVVRHLI